MTKCNYIKLKHSLLTFFVAVITWCRVQFGINF